jgi:hypothetical protein
MLNSLETEVFMKGTILLLGLIFSVNYSRAATQIYFSDTSGLQNDVPMNHPSNIPLSSKFATSNVYVWPNPAREKIMVYVNSIKAGEQGECIIFNAAGQPVVRKWINNGNNDVYLGAVQEGVYVVTVADKNRNVFSRRLIISRQ